MIIIKESPYLSEINYVVLCNFKKGNQTDELIRNHLFKPFFIPCNCSQN